MELHNTTPSFPDIYNKVNQVPRSMEQTSYLYSGVSFLSHYQPWNACNGTALPEITNSTEDAQQTKVSSESITSPNCSPSHSLSSPTTSLLLPCPPTVPYDKNILLGTPITATSIYRGQIANHISSFEDVNKPLVSPERPASNLNDSGNSSRHSSSTLTSPSNTPVSDHATPVPLYSECNTEIGVKKNSRTNYSPQQVRSLEKIFLETPYPEIEVIEQLSTDLSIPEKNLKIWFQNKRARFRKRVQSNKPTFLPVYPSYQAPIPPSASPYNMLSPSSLISPVVASQVASRSVYNLPSKSSSTIQTPYQLYPTQIPHYAPYTYPYMFSQTR